MFLFRSTVCLYTTANSVILGAFVSPVLVGYYNGAEKIAKVCLGLLSPISQAVYPRMGYVAKQSPGKGARLVRFSLAVMGGGGVLVAAVLWVSAPVAQRIVLGRGYEGAVPVIRVLAVLVPSIAVSNVLGAQWMLPLGMDRVFNRIILAAGLVNVGLALVLAPRLGPVGMALAVVAAEAFVTIAQFCVLRLKSMDPFNARWAIES
jgi:PST family polysaccharide transporter